MSTQSTPVSIAALVHTPVQVKGEAGCLQTYAIYNASDAVAFVQLFDASPTDTITVGSTVPVFVIPINTLQRSELSHLGIFFARGIFAAATTTASGSTSPSAGLPCSFSYS